MIDEAAKKRILYVGNFNFPDGNAAGKRVYGNVKLFAKLGYEVSIIDVQDHCCGSRDGLTPHRLVDEFSCYSLSYPKNIIDWMRFRHTYKLIRQYLESGENRESYFAVVLYGSPVLSVFNLYLTFYCRKHGIKVVTDCVDWLTTRTKNPVFDLIKTVDNYLQKVIFNKRADGVICVSRFLASYYRSSGCKVVIVPPLAEKKEITSPLLENLQLCDRKTFIYAGRPFRNDMKKNDVNSLKDRIDLILKIFSELKSEGYDFELHIFGFLAMELIQHIPCNEIWISNLGDSVIFHGHATNSTVTSALEKSHFSILIRDKKRDTVAGFPTKVSESICHGTPVLATDIGDLHVYVTNGLNGFLSPPGNYVQQRLMVKNALELSDDKVKALKRNCLKSKSFCIGEYEERVRDFLGSL